MNNPEIDENNPEIDENELAFSKIYDKSNERRS